MALTDRPEVYELSLKTLWIDLCQGLGMVWPDEEEEPDAVQE